MRSWISATSSLASVVMIVKVRIHSPDNGSFRARRASRGRWRMAVAGCTGGHLPARRRVTRRVSNYFARAVEKPTRHRGGRAAPCLGTIGNHRVVAMIRDAALGRQVHTYAQVSTPDRRQALYLSWVIVSLG